MITLVDLLSYLCATSLFGIRLRFRHSDVCNRSFQAVLLFCFKVEPLFLKSSLDLQSIVLIYFQDALLLMDSRCSGRHQCKFSVADPDVGLLTLKPCPRDFSPYLEAAYTCNKGL